MSVSLDPGLLELVDAFLQDHAELDRSKVMDQALALWSAERQAEAMAAQYSDPVDNEQLASWRATRRAAAERRLRRT